MELSVNTKKKASLQKAIARNKKVFVLLWQFQGFCCLWVLLVADAMRF